MAPKHEEECPICPQHSGLETWVKIGMAGIGCNILLLVLNLIINITLNTTVATIQTRQLAVMEDIKSLKQTDRDFELKLGTLKK